MPVVHTPTLLDFQAAHFCGRSRGSARAGRMCDCVASSVMMIVSTRDSTNKPRIPTMIVHVVLCVVKQAAARAGVLWIQHIV